MTAHDPTALEARLLMDQATRPDHARNTKPRRATGRGGAGRGTDSEEGSYVTLTRASSIRMDRPRWAWQDRIPIAGVTLIAGREGTGKTVLVGHLAAQLTHGTLPGDRHGRPGHILYIGHEDDRATVLVPRLTAAGADLDRFHFVDLKAGTPFAVGIDTGALAKALKDQDVDVAAIILDPLDAHLGTAVDSHKKAEVQASISLLASLCQDLRCAAIGIGHLNKGDSRDVLTKVVGSIGFTTSVRSVLGVGEHPDDPTERVCVLSKANMTDRHQVPAWRFRVTEAHLPHPEPGESDIRTGRLVELGEEPDLDPNSILVVPTPEERSAREEAADWLADLLANGPVKAADIKRQAKDADIAPRTLYRARTDLGVVTDEDRAQDGDGRTGRGRPATTTWRLPSPDAR